MKKDENKSLREFFERVRHVPYCVISPHYSLPIDIPDSIRVLTTNLKTLIALWQLTKLRDNIYTAIVGGKTIQVMIFEKGKRTFPENFESIILGRAVFYREVVRVPDRETYFWMRLYWRLFYEGFLIGDEDRRLFADAARERVGVPIAPRYKTLTITK